MKGCKDVLKTKTKPPQYGWISKMTQEPKLGQSVQPNTAAGL